MTHACGTHNAYRLTCQEYDVLLGACAGECSICGLPADLHIDHDHAVGLTAVRGLVCRTCNAGLVAVDMGEREPTHNEAFYLRYAWHLTHRTKHLPDNRTPLKPVRVSDPDWQRWMEAVEADEKETTVSDEIRSAMDKYANRVLGKRQRAVATTVATPEDDARPANQ